MKPSDAALKAARAIVGDLEPHINHSECACKTHKECYEARKLLIASRIDAAADEKYAELVATAKEARLFMLDAHRDLAESQFCNTYTRLRDALRKARGE